jgi:hypothetical protein
MYTSKFWKDTTERAVATFAQTLIAIVGVLAPMSDMSLLEINYLPVLLVSAVAAGLSVAKSLAAAHQSQSESASLSKDV